MNIARWSRILSLFTRWFGFRVYEVQVLYDFSDVVQPDGTTVRESRFRSQAIYLIVWVNPFNEDWADLFTKHRAFKLYSWREKPE